MLETIKERIFMYRDYILLKKDISTIHNVIEIEKNKAIIKELMMIYNKHSDKKMSLCDNLQITIK